MVNEKSIGLGLIIGSLVCLLIAAILFFTGVHLYIDVVFILIIIFCLGFVTSMLGGLKMYINN